MYKYKLHILPRSAAPIADQLISDHLPKLTITYKYIKKDRKKSDLLPVPSTSIPLVTSILTPLRHKHH